MVTATVEAVLTTTEAVPAVTGGRRGRALHIHLVLSDVVAETPGDELNSDQRNHAYTYRVVEWPRDAAGNEYTGAVGQWYIPWPGQRVRIYARYSRLGGNVISRPNGIDPFTGHGVIYIDEPIPFPEGKWSRSADTRSAWEELGTQLASAVVGGLLALLSLHLYRRVFGSSKRV